MARVADREFMDGFEAAAKQDADEFKRLDQRIAELEQLLRKALVGMRVWKNGAALHLIPQVSHERLS